MTKPIRLSAIIPEKLAGKRLDQALALMFSEHSRARLQGWIRNGEVSIDNLTGNQKQRVRGGERVRIEACHEPNQDWAAEDIPLAIIHEDPCLLVINKPAGLVVHPGAGNPEHTLLNALLHHDPGLEYVPRAGIVHRLDKDTSGLMVVARTPEAHTRLVAALQSRHISREYQAIVMGVMTAGGTIDQPVGRHPLKRTRMAVVASGKNAVTHYRVMKKYRAHTHIRVNLETGRTHQIRVHMAWLKHPLVGDPLYAGRARLPKGANPALAEILRNFPRQALHASAISLQHPDTDELLRFEAPLPADMQALIAALEQDAQENR